MFINYNKFNLNKINILNYLFSIIPLSLIIGNLATNIKYYFNLFFGFLIFEKKFF